MENAAIVSDPGSSHYLPGHSKPFDPRAAADAQESMKAKLIAIRKKLVEVRADHCHCVNCVCNPYVAKSFFGGARGGGGPPRGGAHAPFEMLRERQCGCLLIQVLHTSSVSGHLLADEMMKQCWLL